MPYLILLLTLITPALSWAQWTVVGSDLLAPAVEPTLKNYSTLNDVEIQSEFIGSVPGKAKLKDGQADLALLAAPTESDLPAGNFKVVPIAYEVAFVVVDKLNPLTEISMDQLAAIYGASGTEDFSRWGQLGLQGAIAQRSIQPLALDSDQSVVLELFKFNVLDSGSLKPNVTRVKSNLQLMDLVSSDSGSLAVTNRMILKDKLRPLAVSDDDEFAFGPTPENVFYGEYPLRLTYYLVYPRDKQQELLPILRQFLTEDQSEAFDKHGFVPLPENVRKRTLVELDKGQ